LDLIEGRSLTMSARKDSHPDNIPQGERFKQAARAAECDEDEARWDETLKKVVKQKPEKPE
jgi:hypothetical protein